jgi:flagellar biogenesis protein FliO
LIVGRNISLRAMTRALVLMIACAGAFVCALGVAPTTQQTSIERQPIRRTSDSVRPPSTAATASEGTNKGASLDVKRVAQSLGIVLVVIFAARFAMKKLFPAVAVGRNSQVIQVVSRSVIGPKQQFLLVKLGKRLVLVGDSGASMSPLAQIDDPNEVAEIVGKLHSETAQSSASAFASIFRKAETQFEPEPEEPKTQAQAERRELLPDAIATQDEIEDQQPPDRKLVAFASEINGLKDRVRFLSSRLRGS